MTKRLILIRHAKSSWADPRMDDIDRPLNGRGRQSAEAIGAWLRETGYLPDQVLCSSSARTRETCALLALGAAVDHTSALYHASSDVILKRLQSATGDVVALIAHNPGIGEFAQRIVTAPPPHGRFLDYPTCATLVADLPCDDWSEARFGTARVVNFITPRELLKD